MAKINMELKRLNEVTEEEDILYPVNNADVVLLRDNEEGRYTLRQKLDAQDEKIASYDSIIQEVKENIEEVVTTVEKLETDIETINTSINDINVELGDISNTLIEMDNSITDNENNIAELSDDLTSHIINANSYKHYIELKPVESPFLPESITDGTMVLIYITGNIVPDNIQVSIGGVTSNVDILLNSISVAGTEMTATHVIGLYNLTPTPVINLITASSSGGDEGPVLEFVEGIIDIVGTGNTTFTVPGYNGDTSKFLTLNFLQSILRNELDYTIDTNGLVTLKYLQLNDVDDLFYRYIRVVKPGNLTFKEGIIIIDTDSVSSITIPDYVGTKAKLLTINFEQTILRPGLDYTITDGGVLTFLNNLTLMTNEEVRYSFILV